MTTKKKGPESPAGIQLPQGAKNPREVSKTAAGYGAGSAGGELQHQKFGGDDPRKSSSASRETTDSYPRFLLVKRKNSSENFDKISPFVISKTIYGLIGETKSISKIKDGLLIETKTNAQSRRLLEEKKLANLEIEVSPHATLNISKGVIFCKDLLNCSILRRIKSKQNEIMVDTPNHIITFNKPTLPKEINVAFYKLKVRPYIPPPRRCFNCQRFGHVADKCANEKICACGRNPHGETICEEPKNCVNCNGTHSAGYKNCPKYKLEAAIQRIRTLEKISYQEAKNKVIIKTPIPNKTYATAANFNKTDITTAEITREIIPQIEQVIKNILSEQLNKTDIFKIPQTPKYTYTSRERSDSLSTSVSTQSEQRKRPLSQNDNTSGEDTDSEKKQNTKKKRGRPKSQSKMDSDER